MFGWFKSTPPVNDGSFRIDICKKGISVNGKKKFSLPADLKKLIKIFGSPRAAVFETNRENKEFLEAMHGKNTVTNRVNYAWDSLGVYCYTLNGKRVSCFGIRTAETLKTYYPHSPKTAFRGVVTVNGEPWLKAVRSGEDCEVFLSLNSFGYGIVAEYTDEEIEASLREERDFTGIEVQR